MAGHLALGHAKVAGYGAGAEILKPPALPAGVVRDSGKRRPELRRAYPRHSLRCSFDLLTPKPELISLRQPIQAGASIFRSKILEHSLELPRDREPYRKGFGGFASAPARWPKNILMRDPISEARRKQRFALSSAPACPRSARSGGFCWQARRATGRVREPLCFGSSGSFRERGGPVRHKVIQPFPSKSCHRL